MEITFYRKLADKAADAIAQNQNYSDSEIKRIRYGLVCIFSDLYKFILYLIIFTIFSSTKEFLIAFIGIMLLRPFLGGFHAKNEIACIFMSFTMLLISVFVGAINIIPANIIYLIIFVLPIIGAIIAPVRIKKTVEKKNSFKLFTFVFTIFILVLDYYFIENQILLISALQVYLFAIYQFVKNKISKNS